jgi:hypothetical protein
MSVSSKRSVMALACVTALGALTATPSLAGVVTPTDKTAVSTASLIDSVYWRYGGCHRHYYRRHYCASYYPYYGYGYPYGGWGYPYGAVGAGAAVGAGLLGLGLGIL